jgi:hypothetical protein
MHWQLSKLWQTKSPQGLLLAVQEPSGTKRFLQLLPGKRPYVWHDVKPDLPLNPTGSFVTIARKHAPHGRLLGFCQNSDGFWLAVGVAGERIFFIWAANDLLHLVEQDGTDWVRIGIEKSFTKKQTAKPPELAALQEFGTVAASPPSTIPTLELLELSSEQKDLMHKLRRRSKMLRKTREKLQRGLPSVESVDAAWSAAQDELAEGGKDIDNHFRQAKRAKRSREEALKQIAAVDSDLAAVDAALKYLSEPRSYLEVEAESVKIFGRAKSVAKSNRQQVRQPYYLYDLGDGWQARVGKTAPDNDAMVKAAKANDYWFHALDHKAAHVIVPKRNQTLPASVERQCLILAVHHSQRSRDLRGEVQKSERRHLKKPKGVADGLWLVMRAETVGVSYDEAELSAVMEKKQ